MKEPFNKATLTQLKYLNGIVEATANAIIRARYEKGTTTMRKLPES